MILKVDFLHGRWLTDGRCGTHGGSNGLGRSTPAAQHVVVIVPHTTPKHARMIIARQGKELRLRFVSTSEILQKTSRDTEHRDHLCLVAPTFSAIKSRA